MDAARDDQACPVGMTRGEHCGLLFGYEADLSLCEDLERLADDLPGLPPSAVLRRLTERLQSAIERWAEPRMLCRLAPLPVASEARMLDSTHGEDVIEALWSYWHAPDPGAAGQLGYMLRALFDGRRRAIAIERLWLGCATCQSLAID